MSFHSLVNTRYFSEAATDWVKNKGIYTRAPLGSREYREYWEMHEERCRIGYSVGDLWIPGRHYFYLNFTPIKKVTDEVMNKILAEPASKRAGLLKVAPKKLEFPRFWEVDYEWYNYKFIAWHGGEFMGVQSPGGKHICCAKTRGAGFSYKEASDGVYNFNFIPASKSYYFAGQEGFLIKDGILNKVQDMLDFINENCPEWFQNRMKSNTLMHQVASYIDSNNQTRGNKSEIIGVIVNDPDKTRGKRGEKITFEEFGSFKDSKKALDTCIASVMDGGITVGQISCFGTGGEEGADIEGLEEVFDDPHSYNMLAFPNVFEEGMESTECGYFVPCWRANNLFIDKDGNAEIEAAIKYELGEREKMKGAKDYRKLDRRQAEYPTKPSEVFKRISTNPFRANAIKAQIAYIEKSAHIQGMIRYGFFTEEESGLLFNIQSKAEAKPVLKYPHSKQDDLEGCITIIEEPFRVNGVVPEGLYQVIFDPYQIEEADDVTSLFAVYVLKQYNSLDSKSEGLPVANFVGRPEDLDSAYEALFQLCRYYNAKAQGEIGGGGQGVIDYAKTHKLLEWIEFEPEMLHNKEVATGQKNRSYLMNMATDKKRLGLTYLIDWHKQLRGVGEKGNKILNLHRIYDVGLLLEMLKFNTNKNVDRISAMIIGMYMLKENVNRKIVEQKKDPSSFFNRPLYVEQYSSEMISNY